MSVRFLLGIIDRIALVCGVILGGCLHSFILSYRQRVAGQLEQATADLARFQSIADQFYDGSIEGLIDSYSTNTDPAVSQVGFAIQQILLDQEQLSAIFQGLQGGVISKIATLVRYFDPVAIEATYAIYQPAFAMSVEGGVMAAILGFSVWVVTLGLFNMGHQIGHKLSAYINKQASC